MLFWNKWRYDSSGSCCFDIVTDYNLFIGITDKEWEMITPTGVAIVATLKNQEKLPEKYTIKMIRLGTGKRYPEFPSVLRQC